MKVKEYINLCNALGFERVLKETTNDGGVKFYAYWSPEGIISTAQFFAETDSLSYSVSYNYKLQDLKGKEVFNFASGINLVNKGEIYSPGWETTHLDKIRAMRKYGEFVNPWPHYCNVVLCYNSFSNAFNRVDVSRRLNKLDQEIKVCIRPFIEALG